MAAWTVDWGFDNLMGLGGKLYFLWLLTPAISERLMMMEAICFSVTRSGWVVSQLLSNGAANGPGLFNKAGGTSFYKVLWLLFIQKSSWHQLRYYSHPYFVPPNYKGDFSAPRVYKTGPAGVKNDIFSISCTESDGRVVKWLACILKNCRGGQNDAVWAWLSEQMQEVLSPFVKHCWLTLSVDGQHDGSVIGMQV